MKRLITTLLIITAIVFVGTIYDREEEAQATTFSVKQLELAINLVRLKEGLEPLAVNSILNKSAQQKSDDMFAKGYFAHTAPQGIKYYDVIEAEGYNYLYAGENLYQGNNNPAIIVELWKKSPGHRANLLNKHYNEMGIGVTSFLNSRFVTLHLGKKL